MKLICSILLFSLPLLIFGQENDNIKIDISGVTTVTQSSFNLKITRIKGLIKVNYKIKDSLSSKIRSDQEYKLLKINGYRYLVNPMSDSSRIFMDKLSFIFEKYSIYTQDSLVFSKSANVEYSKLIDEILLVKMEMQESRDKIFLDGTSIRFDINNNNSYHKIEVRSPNKKYNPVLAKFITETFDLFRKGKNDKYLTAKRTSSY
jgi:hypothetical protein